MEGRTTNFVFHPFYEVQLRQPACSLATSPLPERSAITVVSGMRAGGPGARGVSRTNVCEADRDGQPLLPRAATFPVYFPVSQSTSLSAFMDTASEMTRSP